MSVPVVYSAGGIFVRTNNPAMGTHIGLACDVSQEIQQGKDVRVGMEAAGIYGSRASIVRRAPFILFGTSQLATFFDLFGSAGRCINSAGANFGLDAYQLPHDRCNARDLANADRYRVGNGLVAVESLDVVHQGRAEVTARVEAITDSAGNEPVQKTIGIAYPSDAVDDEEFTLYKQRVGGVELQGVKRMAIAFGVEVIKEDADGSVFPEWVSIGSVLTVVTLSGINPGWMDGAVIPQAGKLVGHIDTTLRLAKMANGSSYENPASLVHISMTAHGLACIETPASARERGISTTDCMIYLLHDGDNIPLLIDTTASLA